MPKDGKWWVEPGILTSGNDPAATLNGAGFPDDYTPMIFITGDGHRHPPFGWTQRGVWPDFFRELVANNAVCCHVEVFSDAVAIDSVPPEMADVFRNGKVWGWELDVWRTVDRVLQDVNQMRGDLGVNGVVAKTAIRDVATAMMSIHDMGYLQAEGREGRAYWQGASVSKHENVPEIELPGYANFLRDYSNTAMAMRTDAQIHTEVGRRIQAKIDQYPDNMHLITCGNYHLINNPLYRFLTPPPGYFGIVDQNRG